MFNWEDYREYRLSKVEKCVLDKCYVRWIEGSGLIEEIEDMAQPEADEYCNTFKAGWVISQVMSQ